MGILAQKESNARLSLPRDLRAAMGKDFDGP
jgi:hypothetical protein